MDLPLFITFIVASVALIVIPGPNVFVVVSTSISHGVKRGLQTVLGTSSAMAIQLVIAAISTTWIVESLSEGFEWLRWLGVGYLVYLGLMHLLSAIKNENHKEHVTATGTFSRGFLVSLTNPKTILFFGAFLPQFVSPHGDYTNQIIVLSVVFLVLATLLDGLYAIMAAKVGGLIQGKRVHKVQNGVSGILYLGAGAWLAAVRKA